MESLCCHSPRKRGIQYSAAPGVTGSPAFAGDDSGEMVMARRFHSTGNRSSCGYGVKGWALAHTGRIAEGIEEFSQGIALSRRIMGQVAIP